MTRQNRARWILIFGVLAGLFFSSGEVVRALPFQISASDDSKNTASVLAGNLKSYVYSVHNSGCQSTLLKSKSQKQINQYLHGENLIFDWSNVRANFYLQPAFNRQAASFSRFAIFLILQSDRAPPIV